MTSFFSFNSNPSHEERQQLAEQLHVPVKAISNWFQNRRVKQRKLKLSENEARNQCSGTPHQTTVTAYNRFEQARPAPMPHTNPPAMAPCAYTHAVPHHPPLPNHTPMYNPYYPPQINAGAMAGAQRRPVMMSPSPLHAYMPPQQLPRAPTHTYPPHTMKPAPHASNFNQHPAYPAQPFQYNWPHQGYQFGYDNVMQRKM